LTRGWLAPAASGVLNTDPSASLNATSVPQPNSTAIQ